MTTTSNERLVRVGAVATLIVSTILAGLLFAPSPASAGCLNGREAAADYHSYGEELGRRGTCDSDGQYRGSVSENDPYRPDGKCAVARTWSRNTGSTWQGYSCRSDSAYVNYFWRPENTWGTIRMCKGWDSGNCSHSVNSNTM